MTAPPPASKSPPPASPPKPSGPPPGSAAKGPKQFGDPTRGRLGGPQKVLIYGRASIGKSSLARTAPNPVFLDVEDGTRELDVARYGADVLETFEDLRSIMGSDKLDPYASVVVDTATKVEELGVDFTLRTVPNEKGNMVNRLENYGWGKGAGHSFETFMLFLQDCDRLVRRGKNVILLAHDTTAKVPNPGGEDWIRYEPNLQNPKDGKKNSIRERVIQWADHVLFISPDVLTKDGKATGGTSRTIWCADRPTHIAKLRGQRERKILDSYQFKSETDDTIWKLILSQGEQK